MKKNIFISVILVILATVGFFVYQYFNSFHEVNFSVKQSGLSVDIYQSAENDQKIHSLTTDDTISLQNGDYYYVVKAERFDSAQQYPFKVEDSSTTVTIDPGYSRSYLANALTNENNAIQTIIGVAYPALISQYEVFDAQLYKKGEWYGAVLKYKTDDDNELHDPYRIILHKQAGKWAIVHYPEIVVTKTNFPSVPVEILDSVNTLLYS